MKTIFAKIVELKKHQVLAEYVGFNDNIESYEVKLTTIHKKKKVKDFVPFIKMEQAIDYIQNFSKKEALRFIKEDVLCHFK